MALTHAARPQAPFPWFGGKSRVAAEVWQRFGDTPNYVEPFAGSLAVLLGRPDRHRGRTETVNDADGFVSNFWRAVAADPDAVARWADWPVNENDLHARHAWLLERRPRLTYRLEGDPEFYDERIAGWWAWGVCTWIGSNWCAGDGPWRVVDGELTLSEANRKLPHLGDAGKGVNRKLPHLGNAGKGVNRQIPHLGNAGTGVNRQVPHLGDAGTGVNRRTKPGVDEWFTRLAARLRYTRVACGDWTRVMGESVTVRHGTTGVFLDPPYSDEVDQTRVDATDAPDIARDVRKWCAENGDHPQLRIALCGYAGEGHDELEGQGWVPHRWRAHGGYGGGRDGQGEANRHRETIWFSPHCLNNPTPTLFDEGPTS
jgi:DNA adenine methylase